MQNRDNKIKTVRSETRDMIRAMKNGGIIEENALIEKYMLNCASEMPMASSISFWRGAGPFAQKDLRNKTHNSDHFK